MKTILKTLLCTLCICLSSYAQETQKNYINYQGVANEATGDAIINTPISIQIALKFGSPSAVASYLETHSVTTDANGVFSLQIGNGTVVSGNYNTLNWGTMASYITVWLNGAEVGTTELVAVPYAISSGDTQWQLNGTDIENKNTGTVKVTNLEVTGNIFTQAGATINEFSIDGTLAGNSDMALPTEKAVKNYVDNATSNAVTKIDDLSDGKSDNDGSSLFLGVDAGANDDGTTNRNVGIGYQALHSNTTGTNNVAHGNSALYSNTTGYRNLANGSGALYSNTTGRDNVANGVAALYNNISGNFNVANGSNALNKNQGSANVANGAWALSENTSGSDNVAVGSDALSNVTTGSNNIGIGAEAQVPSSTSSNQVRIGNTQITYAGIQVAWTVTSDKRWKNHIRKLPYGLNMITKLQPVDYIRKNNSKQTREIGFIAQEVEEVLVTIGYENQGFLTKDDNGYLSIRYNDLIPVLTKAIQEQQAQIEALKSSNTEQYKLLSQVLERMDRLENKAQPNQKKETDLKIVSLSNN